jgi:hypothetical protein
MDTACTCDRRILLQPLLAQIVQKYTIFETTVRQNRKTVAARDVCSVFSLVFTRVICCGDRPQTRAIAHIVYEVFVNMAAVRKIDVSDIYNCLTF